MNKKTAITMASNVALALIMTTGCRSLTAGRTALSGGKVDPYKYDSTPQITINQQEQTPATQITPIDVAPTPIVNIEETVEVKETTKANNKPYTPPTVKDTNASYQKYVVPTGYENPTEGLKPVDKRPVYTQNEIVTETETKVDTKNVSEGGYFTYVVKSGDCLSVIANNNGVKTKELAEINGLKPDSQIRIGQKLKVPAGRKPFTSSKNDSAPEVNDGSVYVVKAGDCLSVIAQNLGVKTADLMKANNIKNANSIWVGQKLKVPANGKPFPTMYTTKNTEKATPPVKHTTAKPTTTVKPVTETKQTKDPFAPVVETVKETATKVEKSIEKAKEEIVIPPAPVEAEDAEEFDFNIDDVIKNFDKTTTQAIEPVVKSFDTVKITKGDTLDFVAANFNTTVETLCKLNGFDKTKELKAGEIIKIPSQSIK